jgi:hypothetical protein
VILLKWNSSGVRLADVAPSGVTRRDPNARSGNPRHDTRSGKFGAGGAQRTQRPAPPNQNIDEASYARMYDQARNAARSLADLSIGTIEDFVKDRATAPDTVDIQQFMDLVLAQRKADLVDLLDDKLRNDSKAVKLTTSAGQVKAMIGQMSDADQQDVIARLEGLGHDAEEIQKFFAGPVEEKGTAKPKAAAKSAAR